MSKLASHAQEAANVLACNVKARRGLSQSQVGKLSGIHVTEISRIEHGLRDSRMSTLIRLARALGVPPSRLLDGV